MKLNASTKGGNERISTVLSILGKTYPNATIALTYANPWELLVSVILSAQCTDIMVNKVTKALFVKYPTLDAYIYASKEQFEKDIISTGFFRNKTKNILSAAQMVKNQFGGSVPKTMDELLLIPGVARKTANVVLGNAFGVVEGIAVDTHVLRLSQRLRLVPLESIGGKRTVVFEQNGREIVDYKKDADPVKIEKELMNILPKKQWFCVTYELIDHGRAVCKAQKPNCSVCVLRNICPTNRVVSSNF